MALKVSVKDGKSCEKILKIEVGKEEISQEFDACFQAMIPNAKIPGFRPGKAPKNVVALHYRDAAREQVVKNLLNDSYHKAVQDKSLEPVGYPEIKDIKFDDNSLSFEAAVEVRPKIKLNKVKGLSAPKQKPESAEKELEDSLKRIQESLAQYKAVEDRPAAMGDFVIADYVCWVDGKEVEKRAGDWFELKEEEFLKGFSKQLAGSKSGDEKEVKIQFPADMGRKDLAGKEAAFKVSVKEIKQKILPEMNDDLAREAGEFTSFEDLKEKIRKDIVTQKEREAESAYEKVLLQEMIEKNKLDLPPRLVERRIASLLDQAIHKHSGEHNHGDDHDHEHPEIPEEEKNKMRETLRPEAERQLQIAFLLDEIATKENITVSEEDLKKHFAKVAERFKQPVDAVEKYYNGSPEALDSVRDQLRNEKTIDFIKQNAKQ
ncbi:MAG TPA: trigger factor [Verrucomicrobiae bacterium]|nr:trigger factor [Verrucomicrobiae bacterium]